MAKVLITGGTGLIGQHLSRKLLRNGYDVVVLSRHRSKNNDADIPVYYWDIDKNEIDREALNSCDYIIHLAGVNIGEKRWTDQRKIQISKSRIKSAEFILQNINKKDHNLKAFISASAIGYYGSITSDKVFDEADSFAEDFLGNTCNQWEQSADRFSDFGTRVVKVRTGIVLSKKGGVLSRFSIPAKTGLGSAIGDGKQYLPWIHIEDLCNIYMCAIQNSNMKGAYNAVAPEHITNNEFVRKISERLKRPFWLPNIPSRVIKLMFGEMSVMLLNGSRVSSERIIAAGYKFNFSTIDGALQNLYK